eukprot:366142-Chlamydomonas_euryale.AAC.9
MASATHWQSWSMTSRNSRLRCASSSFCWMYANVSSNSARSDCGGRLAATGRVTRASAKAWTLLWVGSVAGWVGSSAFQSSREEEERRKVRAACARAHRPSNRPEGQTHQQLGPGRLSKAVQPDLWPSSEGRLRRSPQSNLCRPRTGLCRSRRPPP